MDDFSRTATPNQITLAALTEGNRLSGISVAAETGTSCSSFAHDAKVLRFLVSNDDDNDGDRRRFYATREDGGGGEEERLCIHFGAARTAQRTSMLSVSE